MDLSLLMQGGLRDFPPPLRAPLGVPTGHPSGCWAEHPVDAGIWYPVPAGPDVDFYRGNFCGVRVDGIPLLDGMAGLTVPPWSQNRAPYCPPIMAQDVPRYFKAGMKDEVGEILTQYAGRGLTHLQVNACHAVEAGLTVDEFIDFCGMAKEYVEFIDVWFLGGIWGARDMDAGYWRPVVKNHVDALLANGFPDCMCVGWQLDNFNTGTPRQVEGKLQSPIQSIIDMFADWFRPGGTRIGTHWQAAEGGAWNDPYDRVKWWHEDNRDKIQFWHDQGDVDWSVDFYQAKLVDKVWPLRGTGAKLVACEYCAQSQFDLRCSEDEGDLKGFLLLSTIVDVPFGGYGNGARMPDGAVL